MLLNRENVSEVCGHIHEMKNAIRKNVFEINCQGLPKQKSNQWLCFFFLNKHHAGSSLGLLFYKKTSVDEKSFDNVKVKKIFIAKHTITEHLFS